MPVPKDPEKYALYVERQRQGSLGRTHSAETKAKMSAASKGRPKSPEHRAKMRAARLGFKHSPEAIAKMRAALTGQRRSPETRARIAAAKRGRPRPDVVARQKGNLKADLPSYTGLHTRIISARGKATDHTCETCNKPAREWALKKGCGRAYPPEPRIYSLDIADYFPLCASCHKRYDRSH